jgi:hypothetical protein
VAKDKHGTHGPGGAPREEKRDPIADYTEWADHRYDPGYFTGGRLPPTVRAYQKILKPRDKRVLLIVLMIAGLVMVLGTMWPLFR